MTTFQSTGLTTRDIVAHQNAMRTKQNTLANSGGGTVPQFRTAGPPTGGDPNVTIQKMAAIQAQTKENSRYEGCSHSAKGTGTCGGSRKKKMKNQKKNNKKKITVVRRRIYQKKRHDTRNHYNRNYTVKNR